MKVTQLAPQSQFLSGTPTGPAGGDFGGTFPSPTVTKLQGNPICSDTPATDDVLTWDGTAWCPAPPGGGSPAMTVTDETTYGIAPAVGVSLLYARQDHTHGSPDAATGRWELAVITGSPPDPLYADGDYLYIWVP